MLSLDALLPDLVKWDFQSYRVRLYHPYPLRCFRCQQYGHGIGSCKNKQVCGACSGDHKLGDCTFLGGPTCFHCGMAHVTGNLRCRYTNQAQKIEDEKAAGNLSYANYLQRYRILNDTIRGLVPDRSGGRPIHDSRVGSEDRSVAVNDDQVVAKNLSGVRGSQGSYASRLKSSLAPASIPKGGPVGDSVALEGGNVAGLSSLNVGSPNNESSQVTNSADWPGEYLHLRTGGSHSAAGGLPKDFTLGTVLLPLLPSIVDIANDSSLTLLQGVIKVCKLVLDMCSSFSS